MFKSIKRDQVIIKEKFSIKKTKDSILIDTTHLTINECFNKMKNIIDRVSIQIKILKI